MSQKRKAKRNELGDIRESTGCLALEFGDFDTLALEFGVFIFF